MRTVSSLILVLVAAVFLSACSLTTSPTTAEDAGSNDTAQKTGDTTKSGTIRKRGAVYMIETAPGKFESIDSLAVDLAAYENQQVSITGEYCGDTLMVEKVE